MTQIIIELSRHPQRYNPEKLPQILKKQFGVPTKKHIEAWESFLEEYEEQETNDDTQKAANEISIEDIIT